MPTLGYDKLSLNTNILLDLPFREGNGLTTQDVAKPKRWATLVGTPAWAQNPALNTVLTFDGIGDYLEIAAAETADLNFVAGSYSIACWFYWNISATSEYIIGRGAVETDGWDIYLNVSGGLNTVSHRHAHATGGAGNLKSECYSTGWTPGEWLFLGISRTGGNLYPVHYKNGEALTMAYDAGGMIDPDTCNRDLVIGARYTKNQHWLDGHLKRVRLWSRALSLFEWRLLFAMERGKFGV
jgi:hypothetical protein